MYTCPHPDKQRYQTRLWDESKKKTVPIKTYDKDLRDFKEFDRQHAIEVAKWVRGGAGKKQKRIKRQLRPTFLREALQLYFDWLNDIDTPSHKKKNLSESHIQNQLANLVSFKEAIANYEQLFVTDVTDKQVSEFHDYLISKGYANKTYNNKMFTMQGAFNYFIEIGYPVNNPFKEVQNKPTTAKKNFIEIDDFNKLLSITTPENGIKFEKDKGQIKRKSLHRDWLTLFWELALYSGGRREDVVMIRLKDVKEKHFEVYDYKNSKKTDVIRWIARSKEFNDLLERLQAKYNLQPDDYLIEPEDARRDTIMNHASKAFSHYWGVLDPGYYARMYSLRDTHITLMIMRHGSLYQGIFGAHKKIKTSLDNYANFEKLISQFSGKSMLG